MQSKKFLSLRFLLVPFALTLQIASAQTARPPYYSHRNAYGFFFGFSNDSSHILLGEAENRKLLHIGASYGRRLLLSRFLDWQYNGELLPVALEGDPLSRFVVQQTSPVVDTVISATDPLVSCSPINSSYSYVADGVTYAGTVSISCRGRRWTVGEAMSPVGFKWNLLPSHKAQPFFIGHGGYMYSTQPIPISLAGSFNFTFDFGAGIEFYRSHTQSLRAEYRYHHISNHNTAQENPGIDSGLLQLTYVFGR